MTSRMVLMGSREHGGQKLLLARGEGFHGVNVG